MIDAMKIFNPIDYTGTATQYYNKDYANGFYTLLNENEEFVNLIENHKEFSVEEVQTKADELLLNFVKSTKTKSNNEETKATFSVKEMTDVKKTKKRSKRKNLLLLLII